MFINCVLLESASFSIELHVYKRFSAVDVSLSKYKLVWLIKREHTMYSHLHIYYLPVKIVEWLSGIKQSGQPYVYLDYNS